MRLASVRLRNVGPFEDTTLRFSGSESGGDEARADLAAPPPPATVLFGADGTGKTTLLSALATTRPGNAVPPLPHTTHGGHASVRSAEEPSFVVTEWLLGEDDPDRPHPLLVASPTATLEGEAADVAVARRREQAHFDRRAQAGTGFVFLAFSGARWFSRSAAVLTTPDKNVLRYDVRQPATFDDPARADLTRETKQVLAWAAVSKALEARGASDGRFSRFADAMHEVVDLMLSPFGLAYRGVSPSTLEPEAATPDGRLLTFDALPRSARHLVAFGALSLRALHAAYPAAERPREREAVVAIDDLELHQDATVLRAVPGLLHRALPGIQWIFTTSSAQLASDLGEVVTLRRAQGDSGVEVSADVLH